VLVYIREAHPDSVLKTIKDGKEVLEKITQTNDMKKRAEVAEMCVATLKLSTPTVIDREDNKVNAAYAGWPDRMYVVGKDGKIAYKGGPGPGGFRPGEVENWLKQNLTTPAQPK
jgi:type I thyroxine 5'-deiodinase